MNFFQKKTSASLSKRILRVHVISWKKYTFIRKKCSWICFEELAWFFGYLAWNFRQCCQSCIHRVNRFCKFLRSLCKMVSDFEQKILELLMNFFHLACQTCIMHVRWNFLRKHIFRKYFLNAQIFSKNEQKVYRIFARNRPQVCESCIHLFQPKCWAFWKKKHFLLNVFRIWGKYFLNFAAKCFNSFVKISFYVPRGTFWWNGFFNAMNVLINNLGH